MDDVIATYLEMYSCPIKTKHGIYFGQHNVDRQKHGKGILLNEKEKRLYYGTFENDEKSGFGREFYNETYILAEKYEPNSNEYIIQVNEFKQWKEIFGEKGFW